MMKLPLNGKWSQLNISDKFGSLAYSKNINLTKVGYLKLSPRTVALFDDSGNVANTSDDDFNILNAIGRYDVGSMFLATNDEPFNLEVNDTTKSIGEDVSSGNPNLTFNSHGCWWQKRFYESTATTVSYNTLGTWTANVITGLTSGVRHYMSVFKNRRTLCVANGNVVKQYDVSHGASIDLTLPSDYEVIGLAYNNNRMGIITRLGTDTAGENANAYFFTWDGASTEAEAGVDIGCYAALSIIPYKSTFLIVTSKGELLLWNGGGFELLAQFPFFLEETIWGNFLNFLVYGDNIVVDGDIVYINIGFSFYDKGLKGESFIQNNPAGVWCYDPKAGLYHRYSPSLSKSYLHSMVSADINTTTNIITTSAIIPETGNPLIITQGVFGLDARRVYFVIKLSPTTFKIADTKEKALAGVGLDITGADTNNYIWMYNIVDYGISYFTAAGAIGLWGTSRIIYRDVIMGGRYLDTSLNSQTTLCTAIPMLENRGYAVLPRLFSNAATENIQKMFIKHAPLGASDSIYVKVKNKEYFGIPVSTPSTKGIAGFTWTSDNEGYTSADLSEAKTVFDAGEELEIEFTAGAGAGQMVKITEFSYDSGTGHYAVVLEDLVVGAVAGLFSHFIIDNWRVVASVTLETENEGLFEIPIAQEGKSPQLKVELRGYETTIEDIFIISTNQIPAV